MYCGSSQCVPALGPRRSCHSTCGSHIGRARRRRRKGMRGDPDTPPVRELNGSPCPVCGSRVAYYVTYMRRASKVASLIELRKEGMHINAISLPVHHATKALVAFVRCDMRAHTFFHFFSTSSSTGSLAVATTSGGPARDMGGSFAISILAFAAQAVHTPPGLSQLAFNHSSWYLKRSIINKCDY
jgi:hypothetical protein